MTSLEIIQKIKGLADPERAKNLGRFFKTGEGEYGYGDKFLGLKVPQIRIVVNSSWQDISLEETYQLVKNEYHEIRLCGLLILVKKFLKADEVEQKKIFDFYLKNTKYINNWDLIDLTAGYIVGGYLENRDKQILIDLAKSNDLWKKRIAVLATFNFIYQGKSETTIKIAQVLINDSHDLIHKAVGWMLREVGKRVDENILIKFLDENATKMPRTMLRYAIERLPEEKRQYYLKLK